MKKTILFILLTATIAKADIEAKNVAIIANSNSQDSIKIAEEYKKARNIPDTNLISIPISTEENISREDYENLLVTPIRKALTERKIASDIKVLTTIYGIPLKLATPEIKQLDKDAGIFSQETVAKAKIEVEDYIKKAQKLAGEKQDGFIEVADDKMPIEFQNLINKVLSKIQKLPQDESDKIQNQLADIISNMGGLSTLITILQPAGTPEQQKESAQGIEKMRQEIVDGALLINNLEKSTNKEDLEKLFITTRKILGVLGVVSIGNRIANKSQYFDAEASVDSELTLLWWDRDTYPISSAIPNPFNHSVLSQEALNSLSLPILMTSRIDGPTPESCISIINGTIEAENNGLKGKIYIDTRGLKAETKDALTVFDKGLKDLGWYLRDNTELSVDIDIFPELIEKAKGAAIYTGWYQLRSFQGDFSFNPGAIAWHIASEEAVSLHNKEEKGWCKNLIERGAAVCIGAMAEPYLESFPKPKEFYTLLLSGRYSLIEAYFLTTQNISWRVLLIGDPLYRPFKHNKDIKAADIDLNDFPQSPSSFSMKNPIEALKFIEEKKRNALKIN